MNVPPLRCRRLNQLPPHPDGDYILYWMTAHRRLSWNFALDRALELAQELGRPLLLAEALLPEEPWASDRLHAFALAGMREHVRTAARSGIGYLAVIPPRAGGWASRFTGLSERACAVVLDEAVWHRAADAACQLAATLPVAAEAVDAGCLLPLAAGRSCERAVDFRRLLQRDLPRHLSSFPQADPLRRLRLPRLAQTPQGDDPDVVRLEDLAIDHSVPPVIGTRGGANEGLRRLANFLGDHLDRYAVDRNRIEDSAASGLSPWLRHGHLGAHQVVAAILARHDWTPERIGSPRSGAKEGWWGLPPGAEAFLDQIVTWRELGQHHAQHRGDAASYDALPDWALRTLEDHAGDPRQPGYELPALEAAATHDPLWNAAQRQLQREGTIHNYLRMLWGKLVLTWARHPRQAFADLLRLNDRWALDGRDPNSATGIAWCCGRFDRPWFPARPVLGTVRCMTTASALRKLRPTAYLARYGA